MLRMLYHDEAGFIISAELVLISTLLVTGLIVGLSSIQHAIVGELNDVGNAIGSLNQSYSYTGFSSGQGSNKGFGGGGSSSTSSTSGSYYNDYRDVIEVQSDIACDMPMQERNRY